MNDILIVYNVFLPATFKGAGPGPDRKSIFGFYASCIGLQWMCDIIVVEHKQTLITEKNTILSFSEESTNTEGSVTW